MQRSCNDGRVISPDTKQSTNFKPIDKFQTDTLDSGIDSMNFPSHNFENDEFSESVISLENEFLRMQIGNEYLMYQHYFEIFPSRQCDGSYNSDLDSINNLSDVAHVENEIAIHVNDCEDAKLDLNFRYHLSFEQTIKLFDGDKDGDSKLHLSIINGHETVSNLLIKIVPDADMLNFCNNLRQTPLHLAVLTNQPSIVRLLVASGAETLAQDKNGDTPLLIACRLGYKETVKHLLKIVSFQETSKTHFIIPYRKALQDLNVRNYDGQNCLHMAAFNGHHRIVEILLKAGADINAGDGKSGRTVLHCAADRGDVSLMNLLLNSRKVILKKKDYAGLTPLQLACGRNHLNIIKIICDFSGQDYLYTDQQETDDSDSSECSCTSCVDR